MGALHLAHDVPDQLPLAIVGVFQRLAVHRVDLCLLYTSDAADDLLCVDLGGRRIIKKKNKNLHYTAITLNHHKE